MLTCLINLKLSLHSLFGPGLGLNVVDVCEVVFIPVSVYLLVLANEGSLVKRVFVWQVASLCDLILGGVENVAAVTASSVLFASKD